jgi:hypothetical protein
MRGTAMLSGLRQISVATAIEHPHEHEPYILEQNPPVAAGGSHAGGPVRGTSTGGDELGRLQ